MLPAVFDTAHAFNTPHYTRISHMLVNVMRFYGNCIFIFELKSACFCAVVAVMRFSIASLILCASANDQLKPIFLALYDMCDKTL